MQSIVPHPALLKGPFPGWRGRNALRHQVTKPNELLLTSYCRGIVQCELPPPSRKSPDSVSGALLSSEFSLWSQAPQVFTVVYTGIPVLVSFPVTGIKNTPGEHN